MNLLIKIFLPDLNNYDLLPIVDDLNRNIYDKETTKIYLMINNSDFIFGNYDYSYLNENNIPKMINYKLKELSWDIVLPIFKPCITTIKGFDSIIKNIYKKNFPDYSGIVWLNNDIKEFDKYPVIGRRYYNRIGYIYNPVYNEKNFVKELTESSKFINKSYCVDDILFKTINMKSDDDNIYDLRKKYNFGLIALKK
jgi:hypothetical protein